jgi:voltage-gated potassium channel
MIACIWYFLALLNGFEPECWVVTEGLTESPMYDKYIRSLYWTITTMTTIGYGDITPSLPEEYILAMIVMLLGASLYAFIIGNVASLFSNIDARKTSYWKNVDSVLQYFNSRNVPRKVAIKVRDYYEYMWAQKRGLKEEYLLNDLPDPLQLEILHYLAKDFIDGVPLFKYSSPLLKNVLLKELKNETYPPGVEIMKAGEIGAGIYFLSSGKAVVISKSDQKEHCILESGEYFGDLSMLLNEKRTGTVITSSYCEVFILSYEKFETIKNTYEEFKEVLVKMSAEKSEKMARLLLDGIIL